MTYGKRESLPFTKAARPGIVFLLFLTFLFSTATFAWADEEERAGKDPGRDAKKAEEPEKKDKQEKPEKEEDRYFALLGGDVHTVTGPVLKATDVLVKNGVIARIGQDLVLPEDCEKLDVKGLHVYPGLIALGSRGILGKEPPENSTDLYGLNMVLGLAGGLTTVVTGNTAAKLTYGTTDGMILKRDVFHTLRYDRNSPKGRQDLRRDLEKVRQHLRDLEAYELAKAQGKPDITEPDGKAMKGKLEKYLKLLKGETRALIAASSSQDILDACELAALFGFDLVIDQGVESWIVADTLGRAGAQVILTPRRKSQPDRRKTRPTGHKIECARILHDHGVRFAILPERRSISLGGITGRDLLALPMEAAFAVRGGLPEQAALEAITIDAARLAGLDRRVGSIEEGKDGDFIVCDGDLLHYNTLVQWTVVNGRIAYDKAKEPLFAHIRPAEPREKIIEFWPRPFEEMPDYGGK
jgi:imidazolonepropionase-like amidohydrolase